MEVILGNLGNKFEVGKFYRLCSRPVYGGSKRVDIPHLVVHKTKRKIVFEHLYRDLDGKVTKTTKDFRLDHYEDGSEQACSRELWSMIPTMYPNNPCDKPSDWDSIPSSFGK